MWYKQKQKVGIIVVPPFGYIKNKLTGEVEIVEECAEQIRLIFKLFVGGMGVQKIAMYLNNHGYKSPAYYQKIHHNKNVPFNKTKIGKQYLWSNRGVANILVNEACIGTLICGKTTNSRIYKTREYLPVEQHIRHENFYPPIISKELWDTACAIRANNIANHVKTGNNKKIHRYAGFLRCADCGASFTSRRRKQDGKEYIEYACTTYQRMGKDYCASHRIRESVLDDYLYQQMGVLLEIATDNLKNVDAFIREWTKQKTNYDQLIGNFQRQQVELTENIKSLVLKQIQEPNRAGYIEELIKDCETQMESITTEIEKLSHSDHIGKNARLNIKSSVDILKQITNERNIDNAHLHLILERVYISETEDGKLNIEFELKAPLKLHTDMHKLLIENYDGNKITESNAT